MSDAPDGPAPPLPGVEGDADAVPAFDEPWQARAFGVAVALAAGTGVGGDDDQDGRPYDWSAFQSRLIAAVEADGGGDAPDAGDGGTDPAAVDGAYYRQWLTALERLLDERGLLDRKEVAERAAEFAAGDRDASEFVAGDR